MSRTHRAALLRRVVLSLAPALAVIATLSTASEATVLPGGSSNADC